MADERRYDIPEDEAFTPGEDRPIRFTVREKQPDGTYAEADDFAAYSDWEFYLFSRERSGAPNQASRRATCIFYLTEGDGLTVGVPPEVTVVIPADQGDAIQAAIYKGTCAYELWATVESGSRRLGVGTIPFVQ